MAARTFSFFIEKSLRHLNVGGELIFITPRSLWSATSAVALNRRLFAMGTITDVLELGDSRVFDGAVPNCAIWRFERDNFSRRTRYVTIGAADGDLAAALAAPPWEEREFVEAGGHLLFLRDHATIRLGDLLSVRVGAVSGADEIYTNAGHGDREFVCSETARSGRTRAMIWQAPGSPSPHPALTPHKDRLMARRIRRFDESNWWQWGRGYPETAAPRIYVNAKTRNRQPFFLHPCVNFDGSVLALFPRPNISAPGSLRAIAYALNAVDWEASGFVCGGRFLFAQRSLEDAPLPAAMVSAFQVQ